MSLAAFGLAVGWTAAALLLRLALAYLDPAIPPYATFLAATLITTVLAGVSAGVFSAVLGLAVAWVSFRTAVPSGFSPVAIALYLVTAAAIIWVAEQYRRVLRRVQDKEAVSEAQLGLIASENAILAEIAAGAPLRSILERLTKSVERYSGGTMLASVLLLDADGRRLRHGAAPSLPEAYNRAIDGLEIGPAEGSCGTAAYRKEPVYVTDIETDPLWTNYKQIALPHGLRACWSTPIPSRSNTVLGTFALYHREPRTPGPQELEVVALMIRLASIAIEHEQDEKQRQLLLGELVHRVKNMLTVVLSIASSTLRRHTDAEHYKAFEARLIALSRTQELLTQRNWSNVDLRSLVNSIAVTPFGGEAGRFDIVGPTVMIPARMTLPLALSLHELCTNAIKYGALSTPAGRVTISWHYENDDTGTGARKLVLSWRESGGPEVAAPSRQGFGSRMLEHAFPADIGSATVEYRTEGLLCEMTLATDTQPAIRH